MKKLFLNKLKMNQPIHSKQWTIPISTPTNPTESYQHMQTILNYMANYHDELVKGFDSKLPVLSQVKPKEIYSSLPDHPPSKSVPFQDILNAFDQKILPGMTHWQSPHFYAYFCANFSYPALMGDMLASMIGAIGFNWICSPACTELEEKVLDWLVQMLKLPDFFIGNGVIQGTASESALVSLIGARERITSLYTNLIMKEGGTSQVKIRSIDTSKLCVYITEHTHSSIVKACMILGISNVRIVSSNSDTFEMNVGDLEKWIQLDLKEGFYPMACCATCGTTSSLAVDNLEDIGPICNKYGIWLHVDAAFLGSACICPEFRSYLNGIEYSDSFCFNPHKWLLTNFDCSTLWIKEKKYIINALSITPEYLRNKHTDEKEVNDYRDWQIPLGRKMRSLKLYFVINAYGVEGLQEYIRKHIELTKKLENWISQDSRFVLWPKSRASLVSFYIKDQSNDFLYTLMQTINSKGKIYITHSVLNGKMILRISCNSAFLNSEEVLHEAWKHIIEEMNYLFEIQSS